jgi:periplasmic protein CpxP/Spy
MTSTRRYLAAALVAASFATSFATSLPAFAASPADGAPEDGPPHGFGGPGPGAPGPGMPFPRLRGLDLTEAQQDKLFNIRHAQAPQQRDYAKAIRKAREALRELGGADRFDEAKATAASRDLGQAVAGEALLRARMEAQVLAVLTPEQRARLNERRGRGPGHDRDHADGPDAPPAR